MRHDRFHGRIPNPTRACEAPGCAEAGEFRAPGRQPSGFDGPGQYRWFCLEHVRAFNAGYDYFAGMTPDQIAEAQSPIAGWRTETRAFRADAGIDASPRWGDFDDPLEAIAARAKLRRADAVRKAEAARRGLSAEEARDYQVLDLAFDATRGDLRRAYSLLVRRYHPDRNGGDRSHEAALQAVVEAYDRLRKSRHFMP